MTSRNRTPARLNLFYMLSIGLLLLLSPHTAIAIFQARDVPLYMCRMMGVLVLALAAVQHFANREDAVSLLRRIGLVQVGAGLLELVIILVDNGPTPLWGVVIANLVLGGRMAAEARAA